MSYTKQFGSHLRLLTLEIYDPVKCNWHQLVLSKNWRNPHSIRALIYHSHLEIPAISAFTELFQNLPRKKMKNSRAVGRVPADTGNARAIPRFRLIIFCYSQMNITSTVAKV